MLDKQRGAVMLEAAYVLPIMLGVLLFVVEVTGYALNSLAANDVLSDVHSTMLNEVAEVSALEAGDTADDVQFASCSSDRVVLPTGSNATIANIVTTALASRNITFDASDPGVANITSSTVDGFDVYVVNFSGTANTLVIPGFMSKLLPINVDTVLSIREDCIS